MSSSDRFKIPPYSLEAEQSVIGGLMLDNEAWDKIADKLKDNDFYQPEHRILFRIIADLANRGSPFDVVTLTESLKKADELHAMGGEVYLFELARNTPTAANITAYAKIIREHSVLRQLIKAATDITETAFTPAGRDALELIDEAERKIFQISNLSARGTGPIRISDLLVKTVDRVDHLFRSKQVITGLTTTYRDLDELTSGLQPADLIVVAGRPSMGKTTFAMNIAEHAAIKDTRPVLIFSMEMPGEALAMRMMSSLGRIDQHKVRTGKLDDEDWPRITSAVSMLSSAAMFIDDTPALSPGEIRARARRVAKEHGALGLIIIDYLQLMQLQGFKENRSMEISEISRSLKTLAKELHVPIIALSQLNRSLEQRVDKRPSMSDLRDSGAIEQDADLILFIYRDEVYHENSPDKGTAEIIIAKQRNGPIGKIKLTFLGKYTRFENFAPERFETSIPA